jgi:hypothetical protein
MLKWCVIVHRCAISQQRAYLHKQIVAVFKTHPDAAGGALSEPVGRSPARLLAAIATTVTGFPRAGSASRGWNGAGDSTQRQADSH